MKITTKDGGTIRLDRNEGENFALFSIGDEDDDFACCAIWTSEAIKIVDALTREFKL